ncbi:MAG TPA: septum formation initiator family protein [Gaiellaceae bacterium]|nr:septum formation initiator family protein [Gaiellaceae bacterium]
MPSRSRRKRSVRRARRRAPLTRWLAVATILVVGLLYYRPLKSYLETRSSLEERAAQVRSLRAERDELARRVAESDTPEALAQRARRLGLVRPGERLFIVKGIDEWKARRKTRIGGGG